MKKWILTLWVVALASALVPQASAHAHLDRALPAAGSVVREPPPELRLWFTQRLEPAFSTIRVVNASGERVDNDDPQIDTADGRVLRVTLRRLGPGEYRVKWRVLSVDTHVSEGGFSFHVAR